MGTQNLRVSTLTVRRRLQERGVSSYKTYRGERFDGGTSNQSLELVSTAYPMDTTALAGCTVHGRVPFLCLFDRRRKVWRRRGERFQDCCVKQVSRWGGGSIMVWGGISWRHKTQLIVVDGSLTARRYIDEILEPEVVPFLRNNGDVTLFPHGQCTCSFCEANHGLFQSKW